MPLFVQNNLALRKIKVNGASFFALFTQNSRKLFHLLKHRHKFFMRFYLCLVLVLEYFFDSCV